jgi:hypothetical protein
MKRRRLTLLLAPAMALIAMLGAMTLSSTAAKAATGSRCGQTGFGWFVTDVTVDNSCPAGRRWWLTGWYDRPISSQDSQLSQMSICTRFNDLPAGWVVLGYQSSYLSCWPSDSIGTPNQNVEIVQRQSVGTPFIEPGGIAVYPDRTLAIYGVNFYPNDQVFVNGIPATVVYDGLALGQINAIPPASVHGGATVVVQNGFGEQSAGSQIALP